MFSEAAPYMKRTVCQGMNNEKITGQWGCLVTLGLIWPKSLFANKSAYFFN